MKTRSIIASAIIAFASLGFTSTAQAESFVFASGPLTNLDPAGANINGGFTAFPTKAGMYIQQCIAPVGNARPATCSDTIQLWVTSTGAAGSVSSKGAIEIKVASTITGKGVTVDCTKVQCGLFFRLDHTASADTSEDKFLPISFRAGAAAPALAVDEITVTLNGTPLVRNVPSYLAYRADAKIVASAKSGAEITLRSLTPDCTYANGTFLALKGAGQCALAYSTQGTSTTAAASGNFPFILVPGTQTISLSSLVVPIGSKKSLPATTNFGSEITYTSASTNCKIEKNVVSASGPCMVRATAVAKPGMWNAFKASIRVKNK